MLIQTTLLVRQREPLVPALTFDLEGFLIVLYWSILLLPVGYGVQIGKRLDTLDA